MTWHLHQYDTRTTAHIASPITHPRLVLRRLCNRNRLSRRDRHSPQLEPLLTSCSASVQLKICTHPDSVFRLLMVCNVCIWSSVGILPFLHKLRRCKFVSLSTRGFHLSPQLHQSSCSLLVSLKEHQNPAGDPKSRLELMRFSQKGMELSQGQT